MPSLAAVRTAFVRLLVRLVWGIRRRVLERPVLRAVLRSLGAPVIWLMHQTAGKAPPGAAPVVAALDVPAEPDAPPPPPPPPPPEFVLHLPLDYPVAPLKDPPRIAVLVHAYYTDLLEEIVSHLRRIPCPADVYVSTDEEAKRATIEAAFEGWAGSVEIRIFPNRGRNIAPQMVGFRDVFDRHDLLLLLHTKASVHTAELAGWRRATLDGLLPSERAVRSLLEVFERLPSLGIAAPPIYPEVRVHMTWGPNFAASRDLADRLGIALSPDSPLDFPAGVMFWARPAALKPLLDLGLGFEDFAPEAGQKDATLAHAIERLYFHACELAGLRWIRIGGEGQDVAPDEYYRPQMPVALRRIVTDLNRTVLLPGRPPDPTRTTRIPIAEPKAAFRQACAEELDAFLESGARLALPTSKAPEVSILLVLYNQAELTFQCLRSLRVGLDRPSEVIIVDNASADRTGELLDRLDGARVVRNAENLHFLRAVNQGAKLAKGKALLLLNNDARLRPGSIAAAWERLAAEPDLGGVGGRIVLLDGTLQEAGSIIWNDGACLGHGRGRDPEAGDFQFRRDVDYVSGAFLMVRRADFERLGGLDEAFAPAYYEETDLCMRLRQAGMRIGFDPRIVIRHFEFGSATTSDSALALQAAHHKLFATRHAAELKAHHYPQGTPELVARMHDDKRPRLLILDDQIPYPHLGAGYPRALDLLRSAHDAGWFVTFYPLVVPDADYGEAYDGVLPPDVEIAAERGIEGLAAFLKARKGYYDAVLVSRPDNMASLKAAMAAAPGAIDPARLIYDAEAIFATRDERRPGANSAKVAAAIKAEASMALSARLVLAVSEPDAAAFRKAGAKDVRVLGHAVEPRPTAAGFGARREFLFVGALDDDNSPNVDSLVFFAEEVAPRLERLIGSDWTLLAAGRNGAAQINALRSPRVKLLGPVPDLSALYDSARVFVAPTRFAAGLPMKMHEAASRALPSVATTLLARQLGWSSERELLAADDPQAFAEACARLYTDAELWARVRQSALAGVARDCSSERFGATVADALAAIRGA